MADRFCIDLFCRILREDAFVWPELDADSPLFKTLRMGGIACLLSIGLLSGSASAADYYVATNESNTSGDGSLL